METLSKWFSIHTKPQTPTHSITRPFLCKPSLYHHQQHFHSSPTNHQGQRGNSRRNIPKSSPNSHTSKMSWMDSWSRPSKSQAIPPPYYLLPGGEKTRYCKSCGRVVGSRKEKSAPTATPPAYCSVKCRARKPGPMDRRIEDVFFELLSGKMSAGEGSVSSAGYKGGKVGKGKKKKGDSRVLVGCEEVEAIVFDREEDPEKVFGRRRNRARRGVKDGEVWKSVDMEDDFEPQPRRVSSKPVLVNSDGEEEEEEEEQTGNHDSATDHASGLESSADEFEAGGARLSLELAKAQLNESSLASLAQQNNLKDWLAQNPTSVKLQGIREKPNVTPTHDKESSAKDFHPTAPTSETSEPDADRIARLSIRSGTRVRPAQTISEVNGGVGGEKGVKERIVENEDMLAKRREGQRKAEEREQVRCAARRLVAFGYAVSKESPDGERVLCEAVMKGEVVESSFAKGDWAVRFRE